MTLVDCEFLFYFIDFLMALGWFVLQEIIENIFGLVNFVIF